MLVRVVLKDVVHRDAAQEVVHEPAEEVRVLDDLVKLRALVDPAVQEAARDCQRWFDRVALVALLDALLVGEVAATFRVRVRGRWWVAST